MSGKDRTAAPIVGIEAISGAIGDLRVLHHLSLTVMPGQKVLLI
ncbi:hypothetical protein RGQ15_16555 [Paracoccus sp. MBLB3053]|uniref:ABC transporter ATP-binding protein n=1 Tax=Paracoccus aurantius TaxID=3073814 RepID=A0ABU2HVV2_9RHOB|nr:hypothetical protein [Paracoccus sp. MBLB3053]MDS9469173.1 hypothetical protein [Paracoccus sp. MBLB3053]